MRTRTRLLVLAMVAVVAVVGAYGVLAVTSSHGRGATAQALSCPGPTPGTTPVPPPDNDGIAASIDGMWDGSVFTDQSTVASVHFTDQQLGGTTVGDVVDADPGSFDVIDWHLAPPPSPCDPPGPTSGVYVIVHDDATRAAQFSICGRPVSVDPASEAGFTCASIHTSVFAGQITIGLDAGATLRVPAGSTVGVSTPVGGVSTATVLEGTATLVSGSTTTVLDPTQPAPSLCHGRIATITGTDANDVLVGTAGNDVIVAGAGNDVITARGGDDVVCAGAGNDLVNGGTGNDVLDGGSGSDIVLGGPANDVLFGGDDNDFIDGSTGADRIDGGAGTDLCRPATPRTTGASTVACEH
jgi:Ca2+-binding RTX toxin-like protein